LLYLDTSAIVKLYIAEADSIAVESLVKSYEPGLATSILTYAETLSTMARIFREKRISRRGYTTQKNSFLMNWDRLHVINVSLPMLGSAGRVIEKHRLKGADAVHLCSALHLGRPDFASFDQRLRAAAVAEGLQIVP
jgi:predicted nucleic acid-binding protein